MSKQTRTAEGGQIAEQSAPVVSGPAKTPSHTIAALEGAIKNASSAKRTGAKFVNIDTRVLEWLLSDARNLSASTDALKNFTEGRDISYVDALEHARAVLRGAA